MQVYLPAIAGHVPAQMVRAISSFMEFCYLVRRNVINEDDILSINAAVAKFHVERIIFDDIRPDGYSLPRQHSLVHYTFLIQEFGAPNGLCSSITESKHIQAVKEPYRRSSHYEALGQMLVTNQRLDKLAAARVDFQARGMLNQQFGPPEIPPAPPAPPANNLQDEEDDDGGAVDGDIDSEVILAQKPSESIYFHLLPVISNHKYIVQFVISLSRLRVSVSISISLTFQTSFGASSMNSWYKLMQTLSLMMFHWPTVPFSPTQQKFVCSLPRLQFIMPQVTCQAQGGCSVNVFELSTLGGVVLQDTIVSLFNMIPTSQGSVGCTSPDYGISFPFVTTRPTSHVHWSPGIQL